MTVTDNPSSSQPDAETSPLSVLIVRVVTIAGTLGWGAVLFSFLTALTTASPHGLAALGPFLLLVLTTPFFVLFVLPALLLSFFGGPTGAKAGAVVLLVGVVFGTFLAILSALR